MTTQLQTVEITMPGSTNVILSLENYPVCPVCMVDMDIVYLDAPNGDVYSWYPNGHASILSTDGTHRHFRRKKTLKGVIHDSEDFYKGTYTRFFKDGSVEHKFENNCYWWGPTITGKPPQGRVYLICKNCMGTECYETCVVEDAALCRLCGRTAWSPDMKVDCECQYYE